MYPDEWRSLWSIKRLTRLWARSGVISEEQHDAIDAHFEQPFGTVNLMLAIATGIFAFAVAMGLLFFVVTVTGTEDSPFATAIICVLLSGVYLLVAAAVTEGQKHMHNGIDDAMSLALVVSLGGTLISISSIFSDPSDLEAQIYFCIAAGISAIIFRTLLAALVFLVFLMALTLEVILNQIQLQPATSMASLLVMAVALEATLLWQFNRFRENWRLQLEKIEYALLGLIVVFSNYAVIYYLAPDFTPVAGEPLFQGEDDTIEINLARLHWLYYLITLTVPLLMISAGFAITNVRMIRVGTVGILLALTTLRFHFFTDALEAFLIIGGLLMVGFVLIAQRMLRDGFGRYINHPLMSEEHEDLNLEDMLLNRGTLAMQSSISKSGSAK